MNAHPEKSGRYLCQVSNEIGQDLTQVVNFTVKGKERVAVCVSMISRPVWDTGNQVRFPKNNNNGIFFLFLLASAPPYILRGERHSKKNRFLVTTSVGVESTELECEARGDRPITVTWTKVGSTRSRNRKRKSNTSVTSVTWQSIPIAYDCWREII